MTTLRIVFATLVILASAYCAIVAALGFVARATFFTFPSLALATVVAAVVALTGLASGVGLLLLRAWARILWLIASVLLALLTICWVIAAEGASPRPIELALVAFCLVSWFFLNLPAVRRVYTNPPQVI